MIHYIDLSDFEYEGHYQPHFVDWICIKQTHYHIELPVINQGQFFSVNKVGRADFRLLTHEDIDFSVDKRLKHEGSYSTSVFLRCDGATVELSGNVGRYNRPDNLFGFYLEEVIRRANEILNIYNLPPFSAGKAVPSNQKGRMIEWTGAVITRLDITCNYAAFGRENAKKVMAWLGSQKIGRMQNKVTPDGNSVIVGRTGGKSSKFLNHTFYDKFEEINAHSKKNKHTPKQIIDYADEMGIIRSELRLFSRFLTQKNLRFLGEVTHQKLINVYEKRMKEIMEIRMKIEKSSFEDIPFPFRGTALAWKDGHTLSKMSRCTFYRHRKFLLSYGIDIAVPCKNNNPTKIEVVQIMPLRPPIWYFDLHEKLAA